MLRLLRHHPDSLHHTGLGWRSSFPHVSTSAAVRPLYSIRLTNSEYASRQRKRLYHVCKEGQHDEYQQRKQR